MFRTIARFFRYLNPFTMPTAEQVAKRYLDESARKLVEHSAEAVYHAKMVEYYQANVNRLSKGTASTPQGMPKARKSPVLAAVQPQRLKRLPAP